MKKTLIVLIFLTFVLVSSVFIFDKYYMPLSCILSDLSSCIQKASESQSAGLIKRVCDKLQEDKCIELLGILHSRAMDNLIPPVSNEYCNRSESAFCAFSSIAYSISGDRKNAHIFAQKGCELNEGVSCAILAGIELDEDKSEEALRTSLKGCLLNSAAACAIAGTIMIEKGEEKEGMQFIDRCCQLGGEDCCE